MVTFHTLNPPIFRVGIKPTPTKGGIFVGVGLVPTLGMIINTHLRNIRYINRLFIV
jgi:hypothetical protein